MDPKDRLKLQSMLKDNNVEETTDLIRTLKHSSQIKECVIAIDTLKKTHARLRKSNYSQFEQMCINRAGFLFNHYTNIFNKLLKDELDLNILGNFIDVLKRIEDGEIDQHEGSYLVGQLLKKIYIDSAVRSAENADRRSGKKKSKEPSKLPAKKISWAEYKKMSADDASASTTQ